MHIFLPGALPPAELAHELAAQLPGNAPTLLAWMQRLSAQQETFALRDTGCTPAEAWELRRAGFVPTAGQRLSAGLGPLRAGLLAPQPQPVWLAELVHIALGTRHVRLAEPTQLAVSEAEDQALFDAVLPVLDGSGVTLARLSPGRWRVQLPAGWDMPSVSPAVVSAGALDDWWPQDAASRPWRRLLNEIQMVWHAHPVNLARSEQARLPVNSLWLYGGAQAWSAPAACASDAPLLACDDLLAPAGAGDWAAWLAALARLDREVLARHIPPRARGVAPYIVLTGADRLVTLSASGNWLTNWFGRRKHSWTSWWHLPA